MAQPGSQYQTEVETFARVTASGTAGTGPASFRVERRDGLIYEYGATDDSRIESIGSTTPREWALNRIRDRAGNYIDFVYTEEAATGSYRPAHRLRRQHVHRRAPYYSVRFTYEARAVGDQPAGYVGGGLVQESYRLERIDVVSTRRARCRSFELRYDTTGPSTRSRLARLQECAGSACLAPTTFALGSLFGWVGRRRAVACRSGSPRDGHRRRHERRRVRGRRLPRAGCTRMDGAARQRFGAVRVAGQHRARRGRQARTGALRRPRRQRAARHRGAGQRQTPGTGCAANQRRTFAYTTTGVADVAPAGSTELADVDGDGRDDFVFVRDAGGIHLVATESHDGG